MFWQFSPFFMPKSKELPPLFTNLLSFKEQLKGIHSRCTLQKRDRERSIRSVCSWQKSLQERFAQVAHDKRVTGAIRSILQANPTSLKKTSELLEKQMSEFPILYLFNSLCLIIPSDATIQSQSCFIYESCYIYEFQSSSYDHEAQ